MRPFIRKALLVCSAALVATSMLTACGGGDEFDPEFDGPEWDGGCPDPETMRREIQAAIEFGAPPPPYDEFCPDEYARMKALK